MLSKRSIATVAVALAAGVIAGSVLSAGAAPRSTAASVSAVARRAAAGMGLRLGQQFRNGSGTLADAVARLTESDVAQVRTRRAAGESFADIAQDESVSSDALVNEAMRVRAAILKKAVEDGRITSAQADAALARMQARLADRVTASGATSCDGTGAGNGSGAGRGAGAGCGNGGRGRGGGCATAAQ